MADPTLISNETPYTGFTLQEIAERLLASRGLTLDATTMRTPVITADETDAYNRVRRAFALFTAKYPGLFTAQEYETNWTAGDTMLALPANVRDVLYVDFNGKTLRPLSRKMRENIKDGMVSGELQLKLGTGETGYYCLRGLANVGTSDDPEYRIVIELLPAPAASITYPITIGYNIKAPALLSSTAEQKDNPIPLAEPMQEWLLRRSQELWATDDGDQVTLTLAKTERAEIEADLNETLEANQEMPIVVLPEYPTLPSYHRRR
jgi:hypothetical protein